MCSLIKSLYYCENASTLCGCHMSKATNKTGWQSKSKLTGICHIKLLSPVCQKRQSGFIKAGVAFITIIELVFICKFPRVLEPQIQMLHPFC